MSRCALAVLVLAASLGAVAAQPASAGTGECRGFMVCVPVAGPWVVVQPLTPNAARTEFQVICPRGYIAGGLDAERRGAPLDLAFLGTLGSPVNPGISTAREVVFAAAPTAAAPALFQPRVGCIPTAGGGGPRTPTALTRRAGPQQAPAAPALTRRVLTARPSGTAALHLAHGCRAEERLTSWSYAVAFATAKPPALRHASRVAVTLRQRAGRLVVGVRSSAPAATHPLVQVHALCARGDA